MALEDNTLGDNTILNDTISKSNEIHLLGLISDGGFTHILITLLG